MKISVMSNTGGWIKMAAEGVQSIVRENQYGRKFFTLFGNTFPIKDKLSQIGFKFFKGTWGFPVDQINDNIKNTLIGLGVDVSPLDIIPEVTQEKEPIVQEISKEPVEKTMVEKELERMKDGVDMAMKQQGSEKVKGLLGFVDRMIERVAQMTDETAQSEFIKNFLLFSAKFHDYSFHNQMLIWVQKPEATYVKGFKQWMELGREVINWKNSITIIAPMFKKVENKPENTTETPNEVGKTSEQRAVYFAAVSVYDIGDTQPIANWEKIKGKPAFEPPKLKKDSNESVDEITAIVNSLVDWAKEKNIDVGFEKMRESLGGYSAGGKIRINDSYQGINLFSTMVHETAHEVLHWVETNGEKRRPEGKTEGRQVKEIDAETTAYIVLQHYGFESKSTPDYLALWKAKGEDIKSRRENIRKAVQMIVKGIEEKMKSSQVTEAKNKMKIRVSKNLQSATYKGTPCPKCHCLEHEILNPSHPIINQCVKCKHQWNPDNEKADVKKESKKIATIRMSKSQWEMIGRKASWIKDISARDLYRKYIKEGKSPNEAAINVLDILTDGLFVMTEEPKRSKMVQIVIDKYS
jgi:hypothetical protein